MRLEIVILAAGKGKRMHSALPKVLHPLAGRPMIIHLLETVSRLEADAIHLVVGHGGDRVREAVTGGCAHAATINWVEQQEQKGTGHAVLQALPDVSDNSRVLILNGDVPLITLDTLQAVSGDRGGLNLLTVSMDDPSGLGRIVRDESGAITRIVEEKDASAEQRQIREVNSNCMCVDAAHLHNWLPALENHNAQGEFYLTDLIAQAVDAGIPVNGVAAAHQWESYGVNNKADLARLERIHQRNLADNFMAQGVTLADPDRFDVRGACTFGNDCSVDINVILQGDVEIGDRVSIGANSILRNVKLGAGTVIEPNCVIENATIGNQCNIGPFARIRPDTVLETGVRIGNFVEVKKSRIRDGSKVNHLSYIGDSEVGSGVNVGAGVITCNYDGANKHRTVIGDEVFVGSDCQLVAPVVIEQGATIGAGSTITDDVPASHLAVSRVRQKNIANWKRPGKK